MLVTEEMRTAMRLLVEIGVEFYAVEEKRLECGCVVSSGWWVEKVEPGITCVSCSPEHRVEVGWVKEHWLDPEVLEQFGKGPGLVSFAALLSMRTGSAVA